MNQRKAKMLNRQQTGYLLRIIFLLVIFFQVLKQESDVFHYIDYNVYAEKTYNGYLVDLKQNPLLTFFTYFPEVHCQNDLVPFFADRLASNRFSLKFSIFYAVDYFYEISPAISPEYHILKILHKKRDDA